MTLFLLAYGAMCASAGAAVVLAVLGAAGQLTQRDDPVRNFRCMRSTMRGGL